MMIRSIVGVLCLAVLSRGAIVTYDWDIGYTTANPDGQAERQVIGVNGKWPPPPVELTEGDRVIITARNSLPDQPMSLHAHGIFQNGTNYYDGPLDVTQCGIAPNTSLTYNFTVEQHGTYWIHSHVVGQYPDGIRSPFIIHAKNETAKYDAEYTIPVSDWYHDTMPVLIPQFMSVTNPTGAEPIPDSALMGDTQNATYAVEPGKTYRLRFVNMGAFAMFHVWIEGHNMTVIELDGVDMKGYETPGIMIAAAQRVSVLVTAGNYTTNFPIVGAMDVDMFDTPPVGNPNVTSYLVYNKDAPLPDPAEIDEFVDFDDFDIEPVDEMGVVDPDSSVTLGVVFDNLDDGVNYAFFNDWSYRAPNIPTMFTALSSDNYSMQSTIYGGNINGFVLDHNQMIQIVINNADAGKHPFHLHGHVFQLVYRSEEDAGEYDPTVDLGPFPNNPMRRDTVQVPPNGFALLRFRADNPGIWLFHCHIEWHIVSGLIATMVEAPDVMQATLTVPQDIMDQCRVQGTPVVGNAAGKPFDSVAHAYDLSGEHVQQDSLPGGFTAKGYVAMAGCVVSAVLGMATIVWYALTSPKAAGKPLTTGTINVAGTKEVTEDDNSAEASPRLLQQDHHHPQPPITART